MKTQRAITYSMYALALILVAVAAGALPRLRLRHQPSPPPIPPPIPVVSLPPTTPPPLPPTPPTVAQPEVPQVEVVFALDTTSSMGGLIEGAKRKIWSLVNFISSGQPQPHVRIGLLAYRDLGDAYVTRFFDLSDDLDQVFEHLKGFRAEGGGDTPEHVARALSEAVSRPGWSKGDKVARIIYLVGDAPPHYDYDDGFNVDAAARRAAQLGIHVNAIRCGEDPEAERAFRRIASLGKGQFSTVEQGGGVAAVATPYDSKLAELNRRLLETTVAYGEGGAAMRAKAMSAAAAPAEAAADRATFAARRGIAVSGGGDLLDQVEAMGKGAAGVNSMSDEGLPAMLRAMPPAEREHYVASKMAERAKVMGEIKDLAEKRESFAATARKARPAAAPGFDDSVREALKAETKGIVRY